jgi:hypothetical protein
MVHHLLLTFSTKTTEFLVFCPISNLNLQLSRKVCVADVCVALSSSVQGIFVIPGAGVLLFLLFWYCLGKLWYSRRQVLRSTARTH